MPWILSDKNFVREKVTGNLITGVLDDYFTTPKGKYYGYAMCHVPYETFTSLNPTTPVGMTQGLMVSLSFQLKKWEFSNKKIDESIEVNPTYAQYYQLTIKQKEEIESKIKQGLASAAQAVADLELLKHDQRKYQEFLDYMGLKYEGGNFVENGEKDEHSLKAVFIDQVDAHSGEGISMRSIVSRWPTLIVDFQSLEDTDLEVDKIKDKLNVSKAEGVVLATKNKLYNEWKKLFLPEIKGRFQRIEELMRSRETSVESYRDWLRPNISRFKLLNEGLEKRGSIGELMTSDVYAAGSATAINQATYWTWRDFEPIEAFRHGGSEQLAREKFEGKLEVYDDWTKKHLIYHPEHGLITEYPWINDEWAGSFLKGYYDNREMIRHKLYYAFIIIDFIRGTFKTANGEEFDDTLFNINASLMSQNTLYAKLLEMQAKKVELDHYVDKLIGVIDQNCPICKHDTGNKFEIPYKYDETPVQKINNVLQSVGLNFQFFKKGPYERDFDERITKQFLTGMAKIRYAPIVKFIKDKVGFGVN